MTKFSPKNLVLNAWKYPYTFTTGLYTVPDILFPEHEYEDINNLLKVGITTGVIMFACTFGIQLALIYNYYISYNNLDAKTLYNDLSSLADGEIPNSQSLKAYQHLANIFCSFGSGLPGIIAASMINSKFQNWWDSDKYMSGNLEFLKKEADDREKAITTRLKADNTFNALSVDIRAVISTQIVPALAEFSTKNDANKTLLFNNASACFLTQTLSRRGVLIQPNIATTILQTICNDPAAQIPANINNMPDQVKELNKYFQQRAESIINVRSR